MLPNVRTILYATDLSRHSPEVFRYAMSLAQKYDAKIVLLHAIEPLSTFAKSMVDLYISKETNEEIHRKNAERLVQEVRDRLEVFCREELSDDPQGRDRVSEIRVLEGRPSELILMETARVGADLVVMGSHGHTAVGEVLLGTTAHRVMQRSAVPVLLVRVKRG